MSAPAAAQSFLARTWSFAAALIRTSSKRLIAATIPAYTFGMPRNCPGQVARLCGHESQIATCGSHSAGMRKPSEAGVWDVLGVLDTETKSPERNASAFRRKPDGFRSGKIR